MKQPAGYIALLRRNRSFRRLWYGQVASQLGDWLDLVALQTLLLQLTGSAKAVAGLFVAQTLSSAVVSLGAGVVVDRLPRKWVLMAADAGCGGLVLLLLLVRRPDQVWLVYAVTVLKFGLVAFFEPARGAAIPDVTAPEDLVAANNLSGLTWSVMLVGGGALGGLVAGTLGTPAAFVLDAVSFLLSAAFTWSVHIPETHLGDRRPAHPWHEFRDGLRYLLHHRDVAVYALCKTLWCVGGGVLVLLPVFGQRVFSLGQNGALGLGLLYAARGVGAGLGPILAEHLGGDSVRSLRRALGPGFLFMALGYGLLSVAPWLPLGGAALMIAHMGGSIQWVFSTALLQLRVPKRLQGRVFAVEWALLTLMAALSGAAVGLAIDAGWPPRTLALVVAALFVPSGIGLTVSLWPAPCAEEGGSEDRPEPEA